MPLVPSAAPHMSLQLLHMPWQVGGLSFLAAGIVMVLCSSTVVWELSSLVKTQEHGRGACPDQ